MSDQHQQPNNAEQDPLPFDRIQIRYKKSTDQVWAELAQKTVDKPKPINRSVRSLSSNRLQWLAAALVLLFLSSTFYALSISKTVQTQFAEKTVVQLPDQSIVELNAGSSLVYYPYRWFFNRTVELEGEAFFNVEKGSRFAVHSANGSTFVLGTRFNVYTRMQDYLVYCESGKVEVQIPNHSVILEPNELAKKQEVGLLKETSANTSPSLLSWRSGKFMYNTTPLDKVLLDMELEYGLNISVDSTIQTKSLHYTGLFSRDIQAEKAIEIVCSSFGFQYFYLGDGQYQIY